MKATEKKQSKKTENKIIRHVFRMPVVEEDNVSLDIDDSTFEVINICANGVGILIDREVSLTAGQQLDSISLQLDTVHLSLQGKVIHVSPCEFQLICGIEFLQISEENQKEIFNFLKKNREHLFGLK